MDKDPLFDPIRQRPDFAELRRAAAVCHSPGVFHRVMYQGEPLIKGKRVTGFTNGEEAAMNLTHVVPFLVEDELKRIGGLYETAADWAPFAVVDGRVVTGRNPASSTTTAKALMELLGAEGCLAADGRFCTRWE